MRYLVTGGTGFLGGHLVAALAERGEEVVALGRDPKKCAALQRSGIETVQCDLCDRSAVDAALKGVEIVFHVAALTAPWGPYRDFHAANVTATENVAHAALLNGVRRLVFVSSPSVTSSRRDGTETDESEPYAKHYLSPYPLTKKLAEDAVNRMRDQIELVIVRPKAIFGPGDLSLLPRLVAASRRGVLRQIGNGTNFVDLTYVANVVDALLLAAHSSRAVGSTYLITNGEHILLWPVLRKVLATAGCDPNLRTIPAQVAYAAATLMEWRSRWTHKEPAMSRYAVSVLERTQIYSIEAARRDLNYVPRVSVEQGLDLTMPWLREYSGRV